MQNPIANKIFRTLETTGPIELEELTKILSKEYGSMMAVASIWQLIMGTFIDVTEGRVILPSMRHKSSWGEQNG